MIVLRVSGMVWWIRGVLAKNCTMSSEIKSFVRGHRRADIHQGNVGAVLRDVAYWVRGVGNVAWGVHQTAALKVDGLRGDSIT